MRGLIRRDIDAAIARAFTYQTFFEQLEKLGYAVKRGPNVKYTAVRPPGGARFIRLASLGDGYTEDAIKERLAGVRRGESPINEAEKDYAESDSQIEVRSQQYDDLLEWSAAYETASISAKKVIVARMIERVDVYRGYQLKLKLNISVEQFLVSLENIKAPGQAFTA